jgi:hypothetical protein
MCGINKLTKEAKFSPVKLLPGILSTLISTFASADLALAIDSRSNLGRVPNTPRYAGTICDTAKGTFSLAILSLPLQILTYIWIYRYKLTYGMYL